MKHSGKLAAPMDLSQKLWALVMTSWDGCQTAAAVILPIGSPAAGGCEAAMPWAEAVSAQPEKNIANKKIERFTCRCLLGLDREHPEPQNSIVILRRLRQRWLQTGACDVGDRSFTSCTRHAAAKPVLFCSLMRARLRRALTQSISS